MNTSLYLVVQTWTSIRKKEEEEQVIILSDAGDGLAEVKRRFAEISETWFHFHFSFQCNKTITVFCIGQYEFLWTLEINVHLSL